MTFYYRQTVSKSIGSLLNWVVRFGHWYMLIIIIRGGDEMTEIRVQDVIIHLGRVQLQ